MNYNLEKQKTIENIKEDLSNKTQDEIMYETNQEILDYYFKIDWLRDIMTYTIASIFLVVNGYASYEVYFNKLIHHDFNFVYFAIWMACWYGFLMTLLNTISLLRNYHSRRVAKQKLLEEQKRLALKNALAKRTKKFNL